MLKLYARNIYELSFLEKLVIIFLCGFLLPKISFLGTYISIPDILSVFFSIYLLKVKYKIKIINILKFEILITFFYILLLLYNYLASNIDLYSFLNITRITFYIFATINIISFLGNKSQKIIDISIYTIGIYVLFYVFYIIINIWKYPIEVIFYGYSSIRLKLPFEYSGTTSVPFGYLLSLIFAYILGSKKNSSFLFFVAQIFTMSRSAILSSLIFLFFKNKKLFFISFPVIVALLLYKSLAKGEIDHSSYDRIFFFIYSINFYLKSLPHSLLGFGLSPNILYENTGYFYYENIFAQSLMTGGIIFFLINILMYFTFAYRLLFLGMYIYIPVLVGNFFGGYNFFSTISLPLYLMFVCYYKKNNA
jgi:hypothetical protein